MVDIKDGRHSGARVDVLQTANSVCVVSSPTTSQWKKTATGSCIECFGFYCLLTNFHVVPSPSVAEETWCYFGFSSGTAAFRVKLNPSLIFWSSPQDELDCVIVALAVQNNLPPCVRPLVPEDRPVHEGDVIQVWGHPNLPGKPLQQSAGLVAKITDFTLHYRADTLDGFSGSPVISILSGKLVGVHCGGPWKSFQEAGNTGTSILSILDKFNQEFPIFNIMTSPPSSSSSSSSGSLSPSASEVNLLGLQHRRLNSSVHGWESNSRSSSGNISRSSSGDSSGYTSGESSVSVVPSYAVPVAMEVMGSPVEVASEAALGFQVLPVESVNSSTSAASVVEIPCAGSWAEFAATTAVGLVPVVGPLMNSVYHVTKGQYVSALVDVVCAGVDVYTLVTAASSGAAAAETGAAATKLVLRGESGEAALLGELCVKKLMMGARKMLVSNVNQETVKQVVKHSGESVAKEAVKCVMLRSAVVKTTTSALSTATNVLVECGCSASSGRVSSPSQVTDEQSSEEQEEQLAPLVVPVGELIESPCC